MMLYQIETSRSRLFLTRIKTLSLSNDQHKELAVTGYRGVVVNASEYGSQGRGVRIPSDM